MNPLRTLELLELLRIARDFEADRPEAYAAALTEASEVVDVAYVKTTRRHTKRPGRFMASINARNKDSLRGCLEDRSRLAWWEAPAFANMFVTYEPLLNDSPNGYVQTTAWARVGGVIAVYPKSIMYADGV